MTDFPNSRKKGGFEMFVDGWDGPRKLLSIPLASTKKTLIFFFVLLIFSKVWCTDRGQSWW